MASPESSAPACAGGVAPTSGVIHVRTRLAADFTILSNALAQRRGSAVTLGVAAYILSLPDGTPVTVKALCEHFTEGQILISRALRELEAAGYLERRREREPNGIIRTRTYVYDVPRTDDPPEPPRPTRRPKQAPEDAPTATANPQAIAVLASLRRIDSRLLLSQREAAELAPAVTEWLAAGVTPAQLTTLLTDRLPSPFRARPARVLAYRLRETPLPAPPPVHPLQTCDSCDRAFRAPTPRLCPACHPTRAAAAA